jgi:hypothetical protein
MLVRYLAELFGMKIGLQEIHASLRGGGDAEPSGDAFFRMLGLADLDPLRLSPSDSAWRAALVELFAVAMSDVTDAPEPSEAFAERVQQGFDQAAAVLAECKREGLDEWRGSGKEADVFIGGWLANEQLDLKLPAAFLAQCTRLGLSISICTND